MKKLIILAGVFAITTATYAHTGKTGTTTTVISPNEDDTKTKIDPATLPDAVKTTLAGDAYKDWKISNAWSVKADPVYYTVELTKDDKVTTVNIGADGKVK